MSSSNGEPTIKEICKATGYSRSAVYARLKKGETRESLMNCIKGLPPALKQAVDASPDDEDDKAAMTWCKAVLWAAENMNESKMTKAQAGSNLKLSMWKSAQEYPKEFLVQLVPKALQIIDRNKGSDDTAEMEAAENKAVSELQELLAGAIKESANEKP